MQVERMESTDHLANFKKQYMRQATAPLDGMWLCGFVPMASHFGFYDDNELVGYFCMNDEGYLLQFFVNQYNQSQSSQLFESVVHGEDLPSGKIKGAFVSTAEPHYLSLCLDQFSKFDVNALMYQRDLVSREEPQENPPNVLFIMTDQQHAGMMSCAGNRWLQTPALDRLAASRMRFELAYSPNPVCVPSRTSMMTGLFPSSLGFESNDDAQAARIPESVLQHTMGTLLRQAGYETVFGGKTHWARGLNHDTCGFDNLTRNDRGELAQACVEYLHEEHAKPFLLVASFINPHDICYVEILAKC